jgi:group I intron endonuclease
MSKRLTYGFVKEQFEKEGCILLSLDYKGNRQPLKYLSPEGEEFETTWQSWQQGKKAHNDPKFLRPSIHTINKSFADCGYKLISTEYKNSKTKLKYICPRGHNNSMIWKSWRNGHRCPTCSVEDSRNRPKYYKQLENDYKIDGVIYKATNKVNGKVYIGQTVCDFHKRKLKHFSKSNEEKPTMYFHRALKKYGKDSFKWEVIENCDSKKELDDMEFHYIKQYDSFKNGYNMTLGGEGSVGRKHTKEAMLKISNSRKGILVSEETKVKLSKMRKGKKKSKDHVKAVAESKSEYWEITFPDGRIKIIKNLSAFSRDYNLNDGGLRMVAYGRRNHHKGFKCKKIGKSLEA